MRVLIPLNETPWDTPMVLEKSESRDELPKQSVVLKLSLGANKMYRASAP